MCNKKPQENGVYCISLNILRFNYVILTEIIDVVKTCLKSCGCDTKIEKVEDIDDKIIIILYESITGDKLKG